MFLGGLVIACVIDVNCYSRAYFANTISFHLPIDFFRNGGMEKLVHIPPFIFMHGRWIAVYHWDIHISK
jgi:hypothetical protein